MSGGALRLQVVLQALDQATAPFRRVLVSSRGLSSALQAQHSTLRRLNATQRDISAFATQQRATTSLQQAHQQATARVRQLAGEIARAGVPTRAMSAAFVAAKQHAAALKGQHQQQSMAVQRLRSSLEQAGISTAQLGSHERRLRGEIAATSAQMEQQRTRLTALAAAQVRSQQLQSRGSSVAATGGGMALAGTGALGAMALPLKHAMAFESSMADVKKVVQGLEPPAALQQMSRQIRALSLELPMAQQGIAQIVAAAGQAGIARHELVRFAKDAAQMGVAFDTTAQDAGQTMATWRTAFRMNQDEVVGLADKINYLGNTGPASVQKISDVVGRIGALGEVAGLGSGPLAALGATVAGMGIEADVSATGIKNMLLTLAAGDAATKSQSAAFAALGLDAAQMAKALQADAGGAIVEVLGKLQQLPKHAQAATMSQLFGRESIGAIAPLLTNLELLKENFGKVGDAQAYGGSMAAEYAARVGTSTNGVQLLRNTLQAVSSSVGETLLPDFKRLVDGTAKVVGTLLTWTQANPALTATLAKLAIGGAALVTVVGGLLIAGGMAALAFSQIHGAMALLSGGGGGLGRLITQSLSLAGRIFPALLNVGRLLLPMLGGISLPVLAIGAAIAVVAALVWKYWGPIKAFMIGVWQGVLAVLTPILAQLKTAIAPLAPLWQQISAGLGRVWAWVQRLITPFQATTTQLQGASTAGRGFGQILGTVLTVNLRLAVTALGWLIGAFTTLLPVITTAVGGAWTYLQGAWNLIVGLFTGNGDTLRTGLLTMWSGINQILLGWPAKMMQAGRDMITGLIGGITSMGGAAFEAVAGIASGVMNRFKGLLGIHSPSRVFAQFGDFTMQGLAGGLQRSQDAPLQQVSRVGDRLTQAGAGIALGAALPVMAAAAPVQAPGAMAAAVPPPAAANITIHITAAPGTDPHGLAQLVRQELQSLERQRASEHAARLRD